MNAWTNVLEASSDKERAIVGVSHWCNAKSVIFQQHVLEASSDKERAIVGVSHWCNAKSVIFQQHVLYFGLSETSRSSSSTCGIQVLLILWPLGGISCFVSSIYFFYI